MEEKRDRKVKIVSEFNIDLKKLKSHNDLKINSNEFTVPENDKEFNFTIKTKIIVGIGAAIVGFSPGIILLIIGFVA